MRGKGAISQTEITRVVRALRNVGIEVNTFVLEPGRVTLHAGDAVHSVGDDQLDQEIDLWEARRGEG